MVRWSETLDADKPDSEHHPRTETRTGEMVPRPFLVIVPLAFNTVHFKSPVSSTKPVGALVRAYALL